jgi:hypothetical protein
MYGCLAGLYLHAHVLLLNRTQQEPRAALRTIQPLQPEKKACRAGPGPAEPGRAGDPPPRPRPRRDPFGTVTIGASEPSELIERNGALSGKHRNATVQ